MEKSKLKLVVKKVGTFKKRITNVGYMETGDPTTTLTTTSTTIGDLTTGFLRNR